MILLVCTAMLYRDDPTVLVLTVPEFLLVMATDSQSTLAVILKSSMAFSAYPASHEHTGIRRLARIWQSGPSLRLETSEVILPRQQSKGWPRVG